MANSEYAVNVDWGRAGAVRAAARGDVVVIVDVLSFSTACAAAAAAGASIYPAASIEEARALAVEHDAEIAVRRENTPTLGRYSLSPDTMVEASGKRIVLPSPNGA